MQQDAPKPLDKIVIEPTSQGTYTMTPGSLTASAPALISYGVTDADGQMYFDFAQPKVGGIPVAHKEKEKCTDCKGTGTYVGLTKTESCKKCLGSGQI